MRRGVNITKQAVNNSVYLQFLFCEQSCVQYNYLRVGVMFKPINYSGISKKYIPVLFGSLIFTLNNPEIVFLCF